MSHILRNSKFKLHYSSSTGFTLLEMLLSVGIITIISVIGVSSFLNINRDRALTAEVEKVLSLIAKARTFTISEKDGGAYGVHFEQGKAVLFLGPTYNAGAGSNQAQTVNGAVRISAISLSGGGSEVLFRKLTGTAVQSGTITIALVKDPSVTKVITIALTGVAYSN